MTAAPSATSPSPWPAAAYTGLYAPLVGTYYACTYGGAAINLWNLRLTIDETSSPTARLEADTDSGTAMFPIIRDAFTMLEVTTGYTGQASARIFFGPIDSIEANQDGTAHITAVSAEYLLDTLPANTATYTVGSGLTKFAEVTTDIGYAGTPWTYYGGELRAISIGTITNPASYTAFRQQQLQSTDSVLDFLTACANSLGQWVRGDQRGRASTGFLWAGVGSPPASAGPRDVSKLVLSDRWDSGTAIDLSAITTKSTYRASVDDYADMLQIIARYKSGGSEVTKTARYQGIGAAIAGPPLTRTLDVQYRPGAAFTAGTDVVAQRWADSYSFRRWKLTADCRAVWWLEPGMRATVNGTTGTITNVVFNVDQGTMSITLRPTVTWTAA